MEKPQAVRIGNRHVGPGHPVFVIAEVGINHNGNIGIAKELIDAAVRAGCDAIKFQKRTVPVIYGEQELAAPREVHPQVLKEAIERGVLPADAVERLTESNFENATNGDLKYALELTESEYREIDRYCRERGIMWFASPWDEASVDFLEKFNLPAYKIASPSLTDDALLRYIRSKRRPIILSTGMADLPMIRHAVEVLGTEDLVLLHCTSVYPTQKTEAGDHGLSLLNLRGIEALRQEFGIPVGFSSHDTGIQPSYASAVLGGAAIEKHLTLWRGMWGSDHAASVEPGDLERLIKMVRSLTLVLGDGDIKFYPEEVPTAKKLRRKWGAWKPPTVA
ncbi:hypothetical protein A2761_03365 [Candidatus Kaiserbacteria bacterium RIFCSPHIGHO2_01_FULL_51_33]|uniref:PseI/NeuA/B-like domain-containing protein n=1 Tax=Candidatus Kaiserbacteria bacterium RIFCSPLOWO2_01_FULL_51_21 TaxID=1798508 RepID=A0A1F6EE98_9BACT|nr:MAG: hypothetical protein A2761_03365 [Candidatus Kaiserbacteria bacterium RIFCSPHIGHO2_01_FULL_51_33]OGG71989.1 MAG: hypothetical protein A3A35_01195 [Candidatus Kaiserbacteria bacterium RIFCSPLOWO2_01_FULL_51_21]